MRQAKNAHDASNILRELRHLRLDSVTEAHNALLERHAHDKQWEAALHAFRGMCERGVRADTATYNELLRACMRGALLSARLCLNSKTASCSCLVPLMNLNSHAALTLLSEMCSWACRRSFRSV
jgi:pentatricopeptide repeat protein